MQFPVRLDLARFGCATRGAREIEQRGSSVEWQLGTRVEWQSRRSYEGCLLIGDYMVGRPIAVMLSFEFD